jgi:hypothetical protein
MGVFPNELCLALKADGMWVLNGDREQLQFIPYKIIANWGIGPSMFVITICEKEGDITKHYFETKQGRVIQWIMETYCLLQSGKSMSEIDSITIQYERKFGSVYAGRTRTATAFRKSKTLK